MGPSKGAQFERRCRDAGTSGAPDLIPPSRVPARFERPKLAPRAAVIMGLSVHVGGPAGIERGARKTRQHTVAGALPRSWTSQGWPFTGSL